MPKRVKKVPDYLRAKYQLEVTVIFTALFSLVFLLISIPFSHNAWFDLGASEAFLFTAAFFLISLLVIIVSKWVMYKTRNQFEMAYLQYVLWNLGEVLVICLLYTLFSLQGHKMGIIMLDNTSFFRIFLNALVYCFVSLVIPYVIAGMFFAIVDKNRTIRLMNYETVVSDENLPVSKLEKVTLFDNNGVLKLSVSSSSLYYVESDDNYIIVWYTDSKGDLKRYMLRCRLKTVEESFKGSAGPVPPQVHRQYGQSQGSPQERDGYELDLDNDAIPPIPITKTYADNVLDRFNTARR